MQQREIYELEMKTKTALIRVITIELNIYKHTQY